MERIWSIQYLRAIAALFVVAFHSLGGRAQDFSIGAGGVDIFFVISGFIMASLMLGAESKPGTFLWRRIIRIIPLYWATTFLVFAVARIKPAFLHNTDTSFDGLARSLAFIPYKTADEATIAPVLPQGWTLDYEMVFYFLCAAALCLQAAHRLKIICAALIGFAGFGTLFPHLDWFLYADSAQLLLEFVGGIVLAAMWRRKVAVSAWIGVAMLVAGWGILAGEHFGYVAMPDIRVIKWGVPAFLIVGGALSLEATRHLPRWRFGALLGDASYAIYLLHGFVSATFDWFWSRSNWVADISFCLLGSIAVGIGAHLLVEKPVTRFLRTLWTEKAAAPA